MKRKWMEDESRREEDVFILGAFLGLQPLCRELWPKAGPALLSKVEAEIQRQRASEPHPPSPQPSSPLPQRPAPTRIYHLKWTCGGIKRRPKRKYLRAVAEIFSPSGWRVAQPCALTGAREETATEGGGRLDACRVSAQAMLSSPCPPLDGLDVQNKIHVQA